MAAEVCPPVLPDGRSSGRSRVLLRRVLPALTIIQLVTGGLIAARGFPYYGSAPVFPAPLWESPVAVFHLPGIAVLSLTGHCCGLGRGMVIGPRIRGGHIRMSEEGILALAASNWLAWLALSGLAWWIRRRRRPARVAPVNDHP